MISNVYFVNTISINMFIQKIYFIGDLVIVLFYILKFRSTIGIQTKLLFESRPLIIT